MKGLGSYYILSLVKNSQNLFLLLKFQIIKQILIHQQIINQLLTNQQQINQLATHQITQTKKLYGQILACGLLNKYH